MPLVLATSEITASGHAYEDITGVSYEYPRMYQTLIRKGERFVYYLGSRRVGGNRDVPIYFGTGIVGDVRTSDKSENLVCAILDYQPFLSPVPFKSEDGQPLEPGGSVGGRYYQRGVRLISDAVFNKILRIAGLAEFAAKPVNYQRMLGDHHVYASPDVATAVDEFAMRMALERASTLFSGCEITQQSHNNPGFDILVQADGAIQRYIEVKGSLAPTPRFFLTEGERLFSINHADRYTLIIIYGIDLKTGDHHVLVQNGPISHEAFQMAATQWLCTPILPTAERAQ